MAAWYVQTYGFHQVLCISLKGEGRRSGIMRTIGLWGIVKEFVAAIQSLAISADVVGVIVSAIIMGLSIVMGSGVASMFAFAPLVPNFAANLGGNATTILLGMQNAVSVGRLLSPISAVMIAVAGIANISSFDLVKRTSVPVIVTFITSTIAIWIIH